MRTFLPLIALLVAASLQAQEWPQFGRTAQHDGATSVSGDRPDRIEAAIVVDPFAEIEKIAADGDLLVHYPVPLIEGDDLFLLEKGGYFASLAARETQTWNMKNVRRTAHGYATQWTFATDWKQIGRASCRERV